MTEAVGRSGNSAGGSVESSPGQRQRLPIVAIDGPSGAGKSTVGKRLARRLGFRYIDTGAIYRAVALLASRAGVALDDEPRLVRLLGTLAIDFEWREGVNHVILSGRDETQEIRSEVMGLAASKISSLPGVRAGLLELQRSLGRSGGVVMDGRDIGTVVFPDADVKFFLSASVEARAARRHRELQDTGLEIEPDQVLRDLLERDRLDSQRAVAPLRCAEDARVVDSTSLDIDAVVEALAVAVLQRARNCLTNPRGSHIKCVARSSGS